MNTVLSCSCDMAGVNYAVLQIASSVQVYFCLQFWVDLYRCL